MTCESGHLKSESGSESRHLESESRRIRIYLYFSESGIIIGFSFSKSESESSYITDTNPRKMLATKAILSIIYSMVDESSDELKLFLTRKKSWHSSFFFTSPQQQPATRFEFFYKTFSDKKIYFPTDRPDLFIGLIVVFWYQTCTPIIFWSMGLPWLQQPSHFQGIILVEDTSTFWSIILVGDISGFWSIILV